jgi:signal peptidase I
VAVPEHPTGEGPELDLRAQIEARIAERRNAGVARRAADQSAHSASRPPIAPRTPAVRKQRAPRVKPDVKAAIKPKVKPDVRADVKAARRPKHLRPLLPVESVATEVAPAIYVEPAAVGTPVAQPAPTRPRRNRSVAPVLRWFSPHLRFLSLLAVTIVGVFLLRTFVVASFYIPSGSMEPTLHGCYGCEADMVLVDKLSYRVSSVSRADVIVFDRPPLAPTNDNELIKRVIGLPGETVSGHDGRVFIGNKVLSEPYLNPACHGTADFAPVTVPPGHYFMMGDNRCNSFDSRMFGTIGSNTIVGRAFAVIWPLKHARWL